MKTSYPATKQLSNKLLIPCVALELLLVGILGWRIYQGKTRNVLGAKSVTPIKRTNLVFIPSNTVKYYYEPLPNTVDIQQPTWLTYPAKNTFNADSLHGQTNYNLLKPLTTYRIVSLGDSFTLGAWVNTEDNYPEQLENKLNSELKCTSFQKFEVLNLGYGGYDIEYAALRFKLHGAKYNPDLVLWFIKEDDFEQYVDAIHQKVAEYENYYISQGITDTTYVNGKYYPAWSRASDEVTKEYGVDGIVQHQYQQLIDYAKSYNTPLILFTYNSMSNRYKILMKTIGLIRPNVYLFDGLKDVDTLPDGHPSVLGYTTIVRQLFQYLTSHGIITCN